MSKHSLRSQQSEINSQDLFPMPPPCFPTAHQLVRRVPNHAIESPHRKMPDLPLHLASQAQLIAESAGPACVIPTKR